MNRALCPIQTKTVVLREGFTLEELLTKLENVGKPLLMKLSRGWNCSVEIYSIHVGQEIKVSSEFTHPTAYEAVQQCHDRVLAILKEAQK